MLLFANKLGVHWYFRFSEKTADNTSIVDDRKVDHLRETCKEQLF